MLITFFAPCHAASHMLPVADMLLLIRYAHCRLPRHAYVTHRLKLYACAYDFDFALCSCHAATLIATMARRSVEEARQCGSDEVVPRRQREKMSGVERQAWNMQS